MDMSALLAASSGSRSGPRSSAGRPDAGTEGPRQQAFRQISRITVVVVRKSCSPAGPSAFPSPACERRAIRSVRTRPFDARLCPQDTPAQCADLAASTSAARQHDIFAARPTSDRALAQCCTTLDVDVISLDLSQRLPFRHARRCTAPPAHRVRLRGGRTGSA